MPEMTNKELYALFREERRKWLGGMHHRDMPEERACRAVFDAGRVKERDACLARLNDIKSKLNNLTVCGQSVDEAINILECIIDEWSETT